MTKLKDNSVLILTSAEIPLKSSLVRRNLTKLLSQQVRLLLHRKGLKDFKILREDSRIIIKNLRDLDLGFHQTIKIFGISKIIKAISLPSEVDVIEKALIEIAEKKFKLKKRFAVRVKRVASFPLSSKELEIKYGSSLLHHFKNYDVKVNLDHPDITFSIDIREKNAYLYTDIVEGSSGLPYGSQGLTVPILTDSKSSVLAMWMAARRGAALSPLFYTANYQNSPIYPLIANIFLNSIPKTRFTVRIIDQQIIDKVSNENPLLRRWAMTLIASVYADQLKAQALVSDEALFLNVKTDIFQLRFIDETSNKPILRPLLAFNLTEINRWASKAGFTITRRELEKVDISKYTEEKLQKLKRTHLTKGDAITILQESQIVEVNVLP